jgi:hypothetical protein
MPKRLAELVDHYPYSTSPTDVGLLPQPRFSTRRYDALFIHVETTVPKSTSINFRQHPTRIVTDALKSDTTAEPGTAVQLWNELKKHTGDTQTILSEIFSEDTVCLLSMVDADLNASDAPSSPSSPTRKRSMSVGSSPTDLFSKRVSSNGDTGHVGNGTHKPAQTSPLSQSESPKDWAEFSSAGFGDSSISGNFASTLLDKDIEVTNPSTSRRSSKKYRLSPIGRTTRSSLDIPSSTRFPQTNDSLPAPTFISKSTSVSLIELDEAFIDFWSDALLDPISHDWPQFVVGQLKNPLQVEGESKQVGWVVIEQTFAPPSAPPTRSPTGSSTHGGGSARAPVPRKVTPRTSLNTDRMGSSLSAAVKRFSLFGSQDGKESNKKDAGKKKGSKSPVIGELGSILSEEPEEEKVSGAEDTKGHGTEIPTATLAGAAAVAGISAAHEISSDGAPAPETTPLLESVPATTEAPEPEPAADVIPQPPTEPVADATPASPREVDLTELEPAETQEQVLSPVFEPVLEVASVETPGEVDLTEVEPSPEKHEEALPPAPAAVVDSGETPGPQLALDSVEVPAHEPTEPASAPAVTREPVADFEPPSSSPVAFEHLSPAVDETSSAGVDLEEVPIVDEIPQEPTTAVDIPVAKPPQQETPPSTSVPLEEPALVVPEAQTDDLPTKDPLPVEQQQTIPEPQPEEPTHEEEQPVEAVLEEPSTPPVKAEDLVLSPTSLVEVSVEVIEQPPATSIETLPPVVIPSPPVESKELPLVEHEDAAETSANPEGEKLI